MDPDPADNLEERIKSLQDEVREITKSTESSTIPIEKETKHFVFNFDMLNSSIVTYVILSFLILAVLFAWKPSLLLEDDTDKTNEKKLSYKKLIVATIVSTILIKTIIIIVVIVYKNQMKT